MTKRPSKYSNSPKKRTLAIHRLTGLWRCHTRMTPCFPDPIKPFRNIRFQPKKHKTPSQITNRGHPNLHRAQDHTPQKQEENELSIEQFGIKLLPSSLPLQQNNVRITEANYNRGERKERLLFSLEATSRKTYQSFRCLLYHF